MESLGLAFNKSCQEFQTHPNASKVIDLLIDSPNIKEFINWSANGNTGFMHACRNGSLALISTLLVHKNFKKDDLDIIINAKNREGHSGFVIACTEGIGPPGRELDILNVVNSMLNHPIVKELLTKNDHLGLGFNQACKRFRSRRIAQALLGHPKSEEFTNFKDQTGKDGFYHYDRVKKVFKKTCTAPYGSVTLEP